MMAFAALVLAAVLFKVLGNQIFTPLSVGLAGFLWLLRFQLDGPRRRAVEIFLLQFGVLLYALANQDPSYFEHAALVICLLPSMSRLRLIGQAALAEGSILLVLLWVIWSATWTSDLDMSLAGYAMSGLCLAFLVSFVLQFEGDWNKVFGQVLIVLAAVMVGSFIAGGMGHGSAGRTFAGVTLHRNQLGFLLGLLILLSLFGLRWRFRWLHLVLALAAGGLLIYIDSKSAIIATVLTALVFLVVSARRWKLHLGVLTLGLIVFVSALPSPKMDHFALWMGRDPTFTSRTEIWADSLRLAARQPFTGYGYNAVWSAHENRLAQFPDAPGPRYAHAHNAWIDWVLQLGIGGLAAYGLFLGVLLMRAWQRSRDKKRDGARDRPLDRAPDPGGLAVAIQAASLLLYVQVYDLANVSTVPVTRFGFFMLATATLSLWLMSEAAQVQRLKGLTRDTPIDAWADGSFGAARPHARRRWVSALALIMVGLTAMTAYAIWEDGRAFAATERRHTPAPNGVSAASYLDLRQFQWKSPEKLADYARRHRESLQDLMRRSEAP